MRPPVPSSQRSVPADRLAFARRLRELRVLRGFKTARSFAERLGIDENRYTRYERAEVEPDLSLLVHMCKLLGFAPGVLLGFEEVSTTAGFAEGNSGATMIDGAAPQPGPSIPSAAWALAVALSELNGANGTMPADPLTVLRAQTEAYAELIAEPIAAIVRLTRDPALTGADTETRARIAELARRLAEAAAAAGKPGAPPRE